MAVHQEDGERSCVNDEDGTELQLQKLGIASNLIGQAEPTNEAEMGL